MKTTLRFHGGDLAGVYALDDPSTPYDALTFWEATGGVVGELFGQYILAGVVEVSLDKTVADAVLVTSSLGQAILLGERGPLTAPLRARVVGGPMM